MSVCTHVTFGANFPDDGQWGANGAPLRPAGEGVAAAIRAGLAARGSRCTGILQRSIYGWEFDCKLDRTRFICVVQGYEHDQWLLICEPRVGWVRKLFSRVDGAKIASAVTSIHEVLTSDQRFSMVRWHVREQLGKGQGAAAPT